MFSFAGRHIFKRSQIQDPESYSPTLTNGGDLVLTLEASRVFVLHRCVTRRSHRCQKRLTSLRCPTDTKEFGFHLND